MKKIQLVMVVTASIAILSCSKKEDISDIKKSNGVTFEIAALENFTNGIRNRATNDLHSQEAVNNVGNVTVHAFKFNGDQYIFQKKIDITEWTMGDSFKRTILTGENLLEEGNYRFLAIGLHKEGDYSISIGSNFDEMYAKAIEPANGRELFSGITDPIDVTPGTRIPIQITRKVAGVLGYFKNVPDVINDTKVHFLRLNISNSEVVVNLATGSVIDNRQEGYNIIDIDLTKQKIDNGIFIGNDLSAYNVTKLPKSQLSGSFVMPVNKIEMILSLCDENGKPIKQWKVFSDSNDNAFDIKANHFYTLGKKYQKGSTNKDEAIDLSDVQSLNLTISSEWDVIHDLTIQ